VALLFTTTIGSFPHSAICAQKIYLSNLARSVSRSSSRAIVASVSFAVRCLVRSDKISRGISLNVDGNRVDRRCRKACGFH